MRAVLIPWAAGIVFGAQAAVAAPPVVVLDPGHGGPHDGTKTAEGVLEKDIALSIARHTKRILVKSGVEVIMTRNADRHVPLAARVELANRVGADAYVSIHSNAAPVPDRRGVETYILSAHASDEVAAALLHAEEGQLVKEEAFGGGGPGGDLAAILEDLEQSAAHEDSARLAKAVQGVLGEAPGLGPSRGLRQAPFRVLEGATMAAVLVEIGYLSHALQGRYLASGPGKRAAGRALARGILAYLRGR